MDIIDRHFAAENAHDVEATLATYTNDIVWDDITHPDSPFRGKQEVGNVYGGIIDAIPDVTLTSVRRFASADGTQVLDESILTGHVEGEWAGIQGGGAPVEIRLLHVFEIRDELISYENAWFDSAEVHRQVRAWHDSQQ
jgi:steroid delta-isomerase-like uncharacterized protein